MASLSSSKGTLEDGRRWSVYKVLGRPVRVIDDFENAMLIDDLYDDRSFSGDEKTAILLHMVFPDPERFLEAFGDDSQAALASVMEQAFGIDVTGESEEEEKVLDWSEDAARIKATMRSAYGLGDEFLDLPYKDVCELIGLAPHESPMGQALYYRTMEPPARTKWNGGEVEAFEKAQEFYALEENAVENANDIATAMFSTAVKLGG